MTTLEDIYIPHELTDKFKYKISVDKYYCKNYIFIYNIIKKEFNEEYITFGEYNENKIFFPFKILWDSDVKLKLLKNINLKKREKIDIENNILKKQIEILKNKKKTLYKFFNNKNYIKFGEECSICYEKIFSKNNCTLTSCHHSFHKTCLTKNISFNYLNNEYNCYNCPICRTRINENIIYCIDNYFTLEYSDFNGDDYLYNLDNFWNDLESIIPIKCDKCDKYLGTNKYCGFCIEYRKCVI
jgi:hypothetical protein